MKFTTVIATVAAFSMLTACTEQNGAPGAGVFNGGSLNKRDVGTVAGAIGGGVIGHSFGKGSGQTAATIAGTLLGAGIGKSVGGSLDKADLVAYNDAAQRALETAQPNQTLPWKNPQTGNYGTVTPKNYYQNSSGQYCREYSQTIVVGGKKQQGYGTACRQPDGSWQILEQ